MHGKLETCVGCARHVRADETHCPFCDRPLVAKRARGIATLAASVAFGLTLVACYGGPPPPVGYPPATPPTPTPAPSGSVDTPPTGFAPTETGPTVPKDTKAKGD
jgi:hypothetical protein